MGYIAEQPIAVVSVCVAREEGGEKESNSVLCLED